MVGAQKIPVNTPDHIIGLLSHLRLRMEHTLCLEIPRLGEMIAFRKVFDHIPNDVAMDEAFVEALVIRHGMTVKYAPDAVVYNTGPDTIGDFVRQRRRNHAGHLYLKHKYGYAVSSIQNHRVLRVALKEVWGVVRLLWVLFLLATLEGWSRLLGWYDFAVKRDRHVVWNMAWTRNKMCKVSGSICSLKPRTASRRNRWPSRHRPNWATTPGTTGDRQPESERIVPGGSEVSSEGIEELPIAGRCI